MPILNARTPDYVNSETSYRAISGQNAVDPVTGIPIVQGDIRETNNTTPPIPQDGYILLEDTIYNYLALEDYSGVIALEEASGYVLPASTYTRVTQQTGEPPYGLDRTPGTNYAVPGDDDPGLPYDNVVVPYTGPLGNE
jgi:hypothetical protein